MTNQQITAEFGKMDDDTLIKVANCLAWSDRFIFQITDEEHKFKCDACKKEVEKRGLKLS